MPKIWNIAPSYSNDLEQQLLINRKLTTDLDKLKFFKPSLEDYSKELNLDNISKAILRIKKAIKNKETIFVYGDYDVDGVSSCAVVYHGLKSLGANILPYIPHREKEGYGLSKLGLDEVKSKGAMLVITVDNGIVALEQAKYAKQIGLDLIITDHHTPLDKLPEALCIVHSMQICGAAVAWCLISQMVDVELSRWLLQFVLLGTIADLMPLVGVNRALVYEGLKVINTTPNAGLRSLMLEASVEPGKIKAFEIGFIIAPRLNAIGRLEHAIDALRLLCSKDPSKIRQLAKLLTDTNIQRQNLTQNACSEARVKVVTTKKVHILDSDDWNPGVIGLVASRIAEEFNRPAIVMSVGQEFAKGSARSVGDINITEAIRLCSDILVDVGGHAGAAGFTIPNNKIEEFKQRIEEHFDSLNIQSEEKYLEIEALVSSKNLTIKLAKALDAFEPFGAGNPKPLLATRAVKVTDMRTLSDGKHLKFKADGIDVIGFGMGEMKNLLGENILIDITYFLEVNKFNGRESVQLRLKDFQIPKNNI